MTPSPIFQHPLAYLVGVQGVALLQAFAGEYDAPFTAARLADVRALLERAEVFGDGVEVRPLTTAAGYDGWARTYDEPGNGIFAIEEPVLFPMLDRLAPGVAVDAACGTGRLAARLSSRGHEVHGFDTSPAMLARAAEKRPGSRFALADVRDLPMPDGSADLVTCALALSHVEDLGPVFAEVARVLRPGGHFVVSDTRGHYIGSRLCPLIERDVDDTVGYLPNWRHSTGDYLRASLAHGFLVRDCQEPLRPRPTVDADESAEPPEDPGQPPNIWELHPWAREAVNAVHRDQPALLVLDLELESRLG